jgi:multiple sugar transport system permease protein
MAVASFSLSPAQRARRRHQVLVAYAFLAPSLLVFLVFRHGPAVASFLMGFFEWSLVDRPRFVGLDNYVTLGRDPVFWRALWNTVEYTLLTVPLEIVLALILAVGLNRGVRGFKVLRLTYFIPVITATAIVAIVWKWMYLPSGMINGFLSGVGLPAVNWLSDSTWALPALALMAVWKHLGFNMLIFLAGLQGVPLELEEAARMDGAGRLSVFRYVTLPLLVPVLVLATILTTIGSFQVFDAAYVMTAGGPYYATTTLVYSIYQEAFDRYQMGYAATISFVLFLIILLASLVQRRVLRGDEDVY